MWLGSPEGYDIFDEQHMSKYNLDQEHLLLRSLAPDNKQAPAGWWNEFGKGRMCYLSPGHTPEAINHPMTQRLLRNAIRWLLCENGHGTVSISKSAIDRETSIARRRFRSSAGL